MEFKQLGINHNILQALGLMEYKSPSEIQKKAIPEILKGRDILGIAQTGTGKTAAFAVPTIQRLSENKQKGQRKVQSLILTPTRELAIQVEESFRNYGRYSGLRSVVIYGGVNQKSQVHSLKRGVDIVVATPGRLLDLIEQKHLNLKSVKIFTLDEADRMLDMGFIDDIKKIMRMIPKSTQNLLFSATMPKEIDEIVDTLMNSPLKVAVTPVSSTVSTINQSVYFIDQKNKPDLLLEIIKEKVYDSFLVFTRTKRFADMVTKILKRERIKTAAIHGDRSQNQRQRALEQFKDYKVQVLVATDIAARGIDVDEIDYVVNFDLPQEAETYIHRIGRTGRQGFKGSAITLCSYQEKPMLKEISNLHNVEFTEIIDHNYPIQNKTPKPKRTHRKKGRKNKSKKHTNKKKLNGPYDWSNHRSKKRKRKK